MEPDDERVNAAEPWLNYYLEREMSGWRSIKTELVPITSPVEIAEIEVAATPRKGFEGVAEHIRSAMELLGKKPEPDIRNCIKEAISAVEAAAKLLTGEKSGGIDTALAVLDKQKTLHPAFRTASSKLYGYTSDEDGIRHPILDEPNITFVEARFMVVACSAFSNLLVESPVVSDVASQRNRHAYRGTPQSNRPNLERLLVRRHFEPAGGHRANHLPAVPAPPGRPPDA